MTPESLTTRLHDIQDLDPVGIWPLATGWWLMLAGTALMILLFVGLRRWNPDWRRYLPRYGWSLEAARELTVLRDRVGHGDVKTLTARFSELLRRIAIARCGRHNCAGLHGESWLVWLADHDPDGFDWPARGRVLLDLPYAPPGESDHQPELLNLIDAAMVWTSQPSQCRRGQE
ncbi:MAG: DUF4381 domain-containing protein [Gammaproteobacteria bacterium]